MGTVVIVLQGLLTLVFLAAGAMKLLQPREKVIASGGKWAEDFSPGTIKLIGVGELLCALGVLIPQLLGFPQVAAVAATGICVFMAGAFFTHARRKEAPFLAVTAVLFLMAAFVGYSTCPWNPQNAPATENTSM